MSSIFGGWQLRQKPFKLEQIEVVANTTGWWNPDKQGLYHHKEVFLGHQLLASQPAQTNENQPFTEQELYIVADVRLDNRTTLKKQLGTKRPIADHQLILAAYQRYGKACVEHFIGAFAFVIWDQNKQTLFCARDQMGIKPFHYYFQDQCFVFGTQQKSILALAGVDKQANWRNILNKISNFPLPPNSTHYQHIHKLAPGHHLSISTAGIQIKQYWELDIHKSTSYQKEEDYVAHFNELFYQAIEDRMLYSRGVGAHLSGGLDSSGITSIGHQIAQKKGHPFHAFSYSVPQDYTSKNMDRVEENLLAFDLIDYCKIENFHNVYTPIQANFKSKVEEEAEACDGISQSNNVNTEYEIQAAMQAQNIDVALSGFPGDELVTSFCRPYYLEYLERGHLWAYFTKNAKSRHQLKDKIRNLVGTKTMQWTPTPTLWLRQQIINYRDRKKHYAGEGWVINQDYFNNHPDLKGFLKKELRPGRLYPESLKAFHQDSVCRPHTSRRIESETMAGLRFKVEYRYPMADIRLLQYVASIPMEQKITPTTTRYIYRRGMEGHLPDSIRLRDMKYKGSLKTTQIIQPIDHKEDSKLALWETIKSAKAAPFMNEDLVEKYFQSKRSPYTLYRWMILGQLGVKGRFSF